MTTNSQKLRISDVVPNRLTLKRPKTPDVFKESKTRPLTSSSCLTDEYDDSFISWHFLVSLAWSLFATTVELVYYFVELLSWPILWFDFRLSCGTKPDVAS